MPQTYPAPAPNGAARLAALTVDPAFVQGAQNAIFTCLRLQPEETITLITDEANQHIAAALYAQIQKVGSRSFVIVLEDYLVRPTKVMPAPAIAALEESQVSIYCASAQRGELQARMQMSDVVNRRKIRHGHMVNINSQIMQEGMRADFLEVDRVSQLLIDKAHVAKTITVKSVAGTDITATFSPAIKWIKTSGIISPDKWGNLPGGEIFTSPWRVDGTFVTDGVVGDYLCEKYGVLKETPLYIDIVNSRITGLRCKNQELLDEFNAYTHTDENSDRVGEFAIGTNLAVKRPIGHILQDEKLPTLHMAFGHPYAEHTGAQWVSTTHIDCVGLECTIWFDGELVMEHGKFVFLQ